MFFSQVAFSCATFSLNCYSMITDNDTSISRTLERVVYILISYCSLYFFSYMGNSILNLNEEFADAAYDTEWYAESLEIRKRVLLILNTANWSVKMTFTPNVILSLSLYASTLKASFSYLNFLLTMQRTGES
uniref:Odorant receptor 13 n=1 Tax=Drosicha corpulenta TaxID=535978 RepID=A0A0U3JF30_9HEMI|nr:odorant receptor 13 [Drosicha corpulenta]